jgi:hypothetical protein
VPAAGAATTQCGSGCATFGVEEYGATYVMAIPAQVAEQGSVVTLLRSGDYSSEDFEVSDVGTTTQFYQAGLISAVVYHNWPGYQMYQYIFAPDGNSSGLCVGTATAAANGTGLTLQPCGVSNLTLWLPLPNEAVDGWEPIVAGSDTRATAPYVITAGRFEGQLTTEEQASPASTSQLWARINGVL